MQHVPKVEVLIHVEMEMQMRGEGCDNNCN